MLQSTEVFQVLHGVIQRLATSGNEQDALVDKVVGHIHPHGQKLLITLGRRPKEQYADIATLQHEFQTRRWQIAKLPHTDRMCPECQCLLEHLTDINNRLRCAA